MYVSEIVVKSIPKVLYARSQYLVRGTKRLSTNTSIISIGFFLLLLFSYENISRVSFCDTSVMWTQKYYTHYTVLETVYLDNSRDITRKILSSLWVERKTVVSSTNVGMHLAEMFFSWRRHLYRNPIGSVIQSYAY